MSITMKLLRRMREGADDRWGGGGGYDSGYQDAYNDIMDAAGVDDDLDSGAIGDRLRQLGGRMRNNRATRLEGRAADIRGRGNMPSPQVQQVANQVEEGQIASQAAKQINKQRYKLYRSIPLVPLASRADAATFAINTTPTSKCFATHLVAAGTTFRIDTLLMMGQSILPGGAVSSVPWGPTSTVNAPLNIALDTVPITGQITNNSGAAAIQGLDLMVWMEDAAASERF